MKFLSVSILILIITLTLMNFYFDTLDPLLAGLVTKIFEKLLVHSFCVATGHFVTASDDPLEFEPP